MVDPLWSLPEVAKYLGIPEKTIYVWRTRNTGPRGIRVGRHVRFRRSDVESWLDSKADTTQPAA
jgi:excisionase family DNA binding protein